MPTTSTCQFAVGIDVGAEQCALAILRPDKSALVKPVSFANAADGFKFLHHKLAALDVPAANICVGLEATGLYWENLYYYLQQQGYALLLLHPGQTHQFAQRRGLRAKTDRLDATTIAHVVLSGEARPVYVPSTEIASYRELVRMQSNLIAEAARYKTEIRGLVVVLFPEFSQVFADPSPVTAAGLLRSFPSAAAFTTAGVEKVTARLKELSGQRYGRQTAGQLVCLAEQSVSSGIARPARERSLSILLEQLAGAEKHLVALAQEIKALLDNDRGAISLGSVPEFGAKTIAVLRAELGDVARFARAEQLIAYCGLDPTVRESGKWRGMRKISKRGSGEVRRLLYMATLRSIRTAGSAFGGYYRHLTEHGVGKMSAIMAVMRKMLLVAYRLLKSGGRYDPTKVWAGAKQQPEPTQEARAAA
jgi:transposase